MAQIGQILASSAATTIPYAERLMAGIEPGQFARLARPGGVVIQSNHPAFVFGHLALYPARLMERLGRPAGATAVPAGWDKLFGFGAECVDDAGGTIYPPMKTLTAFFFDAYRAALGALAEAPDEALTGPNPAEGRMRELFPTLGAMLGFYVGGHAQGHLGQISAWRRAMGMKAA